MDWSNHVDQKYSNFAMKSINTTWQLMGICYKNLFQIQIHVTWVKLRNRFSLEKVKHSQGKTGIPLVIYLVLVWTLSNSVLVVC